MNVAGAADAQESTAIGELREKEGKSPQFLGAPVDMWDHYGLVSPVHS